jgi:quinol monooxygenase YgiN
VLFYEVYDSRDVFEDHKKTEHFKVFDEGTQSLRAERGPVPSVNASMTFFARTCSRRRSDFIE